LIFILHVVYLPTKTAVEDLLFPSFKISWKPSKKKTPGFYKVGILPGVYKKRLLIFFLSLVNDALFCPNLVQISGVTFIFGEKYTISCIVLA